MYKRLALITGINGQDGSYLVELLLKKEYFVIGLKRRSSTINTQRVDHLYNNPNFKMEYYDLNDTGRIWELLNIYKPNEIYNLAAMSQVRVSFDSAENCVDGIVNGTLRILNAMKTIVPECKLYQACYSDDTLVLSYEGLKNYKDLKVGELVYSINLTTRELELKSIDKIYEYDYDGEMIHFLNKRIDCLVTPNHKMFFEDDCNKIKSIEAEKVKDLLPYPRNSHLSLPTTTWKGKYIKNINFENFIDINDKSDNTFKNLIYEMESEDFCYLLGLYIGDGYTKNIKKAKIKCSKNEVKNFKDIKTGKFSKINLPVKNTEYKSNYIQFAIPEKDPARQKLINILKKYNIDYKIHPITIDFSSFTLSRMFKLCGNNVYDKYIPKWILDLSSDLLLKIFEGLIDSDGHTRKNITGKRHIYTTVSKELAKDFIELTYKIGKIPNMRLVPPKKVFFKKENRFFNSSGCFIISVGSKTKNKIYNGNIKSKDYKGKVWCLEVKDNHNFLTFRNGKFAFSGNSSSEMFGTNPVMPLNEKSIMIPASPYAVAKLASQHMVDVYRKSYGLFACSGILFNHECFFSDTPVIIKKNGDIDIVYISSLVPNRKDILHDTTNLTKDYNNVNIEVWDGYDFVKLKAVSRKKLTSLDTQNQQRQITVAPIGSVYTTPNHKLIKHSGEKLSASSFKNKDKLLTGNMPTFVKTKKISCEFSELLGLLCGDGHVSSSGLRLTNNDKNIRSRFFDLCKQSFCNIGYRESQYISGYQGTTTHIDINGLTKNHLSYLREILYDFKTKHKKVPQIVINSSEEVQMSFLRGYYMADGLKSDDKTYEFSSFKTNSPLLAQGLIFLISNTTKQSFCINVFEQRKKLYIQINLHSPRNLKKGQHLKNEQSTIKKIFTKEENNQHVFDIETETGQVMAGVGCMIVGNSPRRGETFVTRKITMAVARIKYGLQEKLCLGNLEAKRDWGHAKDYVEAMYLMLQQQTPEDYVICSGETHSIREFLDLTFEYAGLGDPMKYVEIDPKYFRPQEVPLLLGDYSKAKKNLGWEPKIKFEKLVKMMYDSDELLIKQEIAKGSQKWKI